MRLSHCVVAALVAAAIVSGCGTSKSAGPLEAGPGRETDLKPVTADEVFTDGTALLILDGKNDATILKVESLDPSRSLTYLGARIVGPNRTLTTDQFKEGWGSDTFDGRPVTEATGLRIKPANQTFNGNGYELLLGYRVKEPEYTLRAGVRVTYRVNGKTYEAILPNNIVTCPPDRTSDSCMNEANKHPGA